MTPAIEEQTEPVRRRRKRRPRSATPPSAAARGRLRNVYFGGAALWGFLTGTGSILIGLSLVDATFSPGPLALTLILVAAGLALVGGLITAAAYRQATRRRR